MDNSIRITLIVAATIILLGLIGSYTVFQILPTKMDSAKVTTNGISEITVQPDLISIYMDIETKGTTAKESTDKNTEIQDKILTELIKLGFERKEIQTVSFNTYEEFDWNYNARRSLGFKTSHQMKINLNISDLHDSGEIIDAVSSNGAVVSYINFELTQDNQNKYKAQALKEATADARNKAEAIAEGSGKEITRIVSIYDSGYNYNPWRYYDNVAGSAEGAVLDTKAALTNIQPSDKVISASISVTYQLG